nr:PREDICTED: SKI family transcriptional corepressor 1 [Anolis carolinensis]|eukprot:XP_008118640.1 PREDICTED: SKI family transcriptional corepressor 1 [Anolis carolinensis]
MKGEGVLEAERGRWAWLAQVKTHPCPEAEGPFLLCFFLRQVFPPPAREDPPPALKASLALPVGQGATYLRSPDRNGEESLSIDIISGTQLGEKDFGNMARDELQKLLLEQMELRKKLEREFQSLKDNFQDQMKRELAYREEMVQQLQIVRDTLCNELDQERKARYAIQQKLKEAHDALHHFSCKMLTPRHCTGTCSFKPPLLPQ